MGGCASEYTQVLGKMLYDEPCIQSGVTFVQVAAALSGSSIVTLGSSIAG